MLPPESLIYSFVAIVNLQPFMKQKKYHKIVLLVNRIVNLKKIFNPGKIKSADDYL